MLGATKITLFEKISNMGQKILLDIHHHMHQHMVEDTQEDAYDIQEDVEDTQKDTEDTDDNQEILTIKIIKVDYDYIIKITR